MESGRYVKQRNKVLAERVIRALGTRNMTGYYAADRQEALAAALSLIPEGSRIAMGGCLTAHEIGLVQALKAGNYDFIDYGEEDPRETELKAYSADIYLSSANAMSEDGVLVNIDGNSNRVSAIAYGPKKLIVLCSLNKVCPDTDSAMKRARNVAAPLNALRFQGVRSVPCQKTGSCLNCRTPDTLCCQILITRYSRHRDRIHVILIDEELGF